MPQPRSVNAALPPPVYRPAPPLQAKSAVPPLPNAQGIQRHVIQPVIRNEKGKPYQALSRTKWYKSLTASQQQIARDLHQRLDIYPVSTIHHEIQVEELKKATAPVLTPTPTFPIFSPFGTAPLFPTAPSFPVWPTPVPLPILTTTPVNAATPMNLTPTAPVTATITTTTATTFQNDFFDGFGWGKSPDTGMEVESSDDEDEPSVSKVNQYYQKKIEDRLEKAQKRTLGDYDEDSSDSETEVGTDPARRERRRKYKASQLGALASTFYPLQEDDELKFRVDLARDRKNANDTRKGKRQMYDRRTRLKFGHVAKQFLYTNVGHNPYLRRAHRAGVSKGKVKEGGSKNYDSSQQNIRTHLHKIIVADHATMVWSRKDFPDDKTWNAVKFIIDDVMNNPSKGDTFYDRVTSGQDTKGSSARVAFHHVAWKESMNGAFAKYALNPYNLTALSDLRELLNKTKIRKVEAGRGTLPLVGAHDAIGHQGCGFRSDQKSDFERSQGGGQFKDIDLEAAYYVIKPLTEPRVKKAELYKVPQSS